MEDALGRLVELQRKWNTNQLPWIAAYTDPEITHEQYVEIAYETVERQRLLVLEAAAIIEQLPESEWRDALKPWSEFLQERFQAFQELVRASIMGDEDSFSEAVTSYQELTSPDRAIELMEQIFSHPTMAAYLADDGARIDDLRSAMELLFSAAAPSDGAERNGESEEGYLKDVRPELAGTKYVDIPGDVLIDAALRLCQEIQEGVGFTTAAADAVLLAFMANGLPIDDVDETGSLSGDLKHLASVVLLLGTQHFCPDQYDKLQATFDDTS